MWSCSLQMSIRFASVLAKRLSGNSCCVRQVCTYATDIHTGDHFLRLTARLSFRVHFCVIANISLALVYFLSPFLCSSISNKDQTHSWSPRKQCGWRCKSDVCMLPVRKNKHCKSDHSTCSVSSGTGSGVGTYILNLLEEEYPEIFRSDMQSIHLYGMYAVCCATVHGGPMKSKSLRVSLKIILNYACKDSFFLCKIWVQYTSTEACNIFDCY